MRFLEGIFGGWPLFAPGGVEAAQGILGDPQRVVDAATTTREMQADSLWRRRPSMTSWDSVDDMTIPEMIRAEEGIARAQRATGAIDVDFEVVPEPKALIGDGS